MDQSTPPAAKPKFAVGDYIASEESLFLEIVAVVEGMLPIYGYRTCKEMDLITWRSEWELYEHDGLRKATPDFKPYRQLQTGDTIKMGLADNREYMRVLARISDVVLLSRIPNKEMVGSLKTALNGLTGMPIDLTEMMSPEQQEHIKHMNSTVTANKMAAEWVHVDVLCLLNWPIVSKEF